MTYTVDLLQPLDELGMHSAFAKEAEFPRIGPSARITKVVQKAAIEVDEEGIVAAAATALSMSDPSATPRARFMADHPFLFLLRHRPSGRVLFIGRVVDPRG